MPRKAIISIQQLLLQLQSFLLSQKQQSFQWEDIFVLIQDQTTAPVENKRAESHRNYIDIQYLFTGKEVQGYAPLLPGVTGEEPAGKDNIFYADVENEQFVTLHPGEFTVFFTNDIHRPNCTMDEPVNIHKAVVKIKESLIK